MKKKALGELVFESYRRAGLAQTVEFLDRLKDFGFRNATRGGISIGIEDLHIPAEKETLLREAEARVERFQRAYQTGNIATNGERYNKVDRHLDPRQQRHRGRDGHSDARVEGRVQSGVHDV